MDKKPTLSAPNEAMFSEAARIAEHQRYNKHKAQGGRIAALEKLHVRLVDDARLYESDDLQDQRDAVADSLLAIVDYLKAQGFNDATLAPLMRPVAALSERENNSIDLMFAQRARKGRPRATLAEHERSGILAALSDAWLRSHAEQDQLQSDKLANAARKMKGRWFGNVTRAQLETARELVSQESPDHPAVTTAKRFEQHIAVAEETYGDAGAFTILVRFLNDQKVTFGIGEGGILKTPPISPTE